jgi:hypothetical protein
LGLLQKSALRAKPEAEARLAALILAGFPLACRAGRPHAVSTLAGVEAEEAYPFWLLGAMMMMMMVLACVGVAIACRWLRGGRAATPIVVINVQAMAIHDEAVGEAAGAVEVRGAPLQAALDLAPEVAAPIAAAAPALAEQAAEVPVPAVVARGAPLPAARGIYFATRQGKKLHIDERCGAIRYREKTRLEIEGGHIDQSLLCRLCAVRD